MTCQFEMSSANGGAVLPFAIRHPLLMAVKEALQNVVKHAGASRVIISMAASGSAIKLEVSDNGKGIGPMEGDPARGDGLANMAGRLSEIGGTCVVGRLPSGGTRVTLSVPWTSGT